MWKRQTKEDNYVPDTWLHSVNRRTNTYGQGYWNMVKHTAVLMQQLSIVVVFSTVYRLALTEDTEIVQGAAPSISLSHLLLIDFGIIVSFYIIHFVLSLQIKVPQDSAGAAHAFFMQPHRIILFLVILMAVSPVLHTLTKAYASDTIYMLAMFLGSLHSKSMRDCCFRCSRCSRCSLFLLFKSSKVVSVSRATLLFFITSFLLRFHLYVVPKT